MTTTPDIDPPIREEVRKGVLDALNSQADDQNAGFKMIFAAGWQRVQNLAKRDGSQIPLRLWLLLAEHAGPEMAVCARQKDLADELGVQSKTIQRAIKVLEEEGAIITLREWSLPVYCLNPAEVWGSWNRAKKWAPFRTRVLVPKNTPEGEAFTRRIAHLFTEKGAEVRQHSKAFKALPGKFSEAEKIPDEYPDD